MAVPGSVVGVGKLITPGGQVGPKGDAGTSANAPFVLQASAYTLTVSDSGKYFICSGGSWTLTLPAPAVGLAYRVRNDMGIGGTTGTITVQPTGGTIDGASNLALLPQQECTFFTDGTNWRTFELKREVIIGVLNITSAITSGVFYLPLGYRYFELTFTGLQFSAITLLRGQLSITGGVSWVTTGYYHSILYDVTATTAGNSNVENDATFYMSPNTISPYGQSRVIIYPGSGAIYPHWTFDGWGRTAANTSNKWNGGGALIGVVGPVNALAYSVPTGTLNNMFLTVKGVV